MPHCLPLTVGNFTTNLAEGYMHIHSTDRRVALGKDDVLERL